MRFVPIKTAERQAALTMLGVRDLLVKQRTMLINAIRGHAAEFGVTAAKSLPSRKRGYPTRKPFARARLGGLRRPGSG
jgi:transposase